MNECRHIPKCEDCRQENFEYHVAGVVIGDWAAAIGNLIEQAREAETVTEAKWLLDAIGGLAEAIAWRANVDIEEVTLSAERGPKPVRMEVKA
jgi:hypothetical protein